MKGAQSSGLWPFCAVQSVEEEQALFADEGLGGVVPLLNQNGLVERVVRLAQRYPLVKVSDNDALVDLVLVSPGVDAHLAQFAAALSGLATEYIDDEIGKVIGETVASVIILYAPGKSSSSAVVDAIAVLENRGIRWSFALATDPITGRFSLIKAMMMDQIPARGTLEFFGKPGAADTPGRERLARETDLTVITGHANGFDVSLSHDAILCARAGMAQAEINARARVFPCFNDERCFRQNTVGPARDLLPVDTIGASVLALSGCGVMPFGANRMDFDAGLVHQACNAMMAALITTTVETVGREETDLLCAGLVAEGWALGDVVRTINRLRSDVFWDSTGLPPSVGPYVLFGNPNLCLTGFPMQRPIPVSRSDSARAHLIFEVETTKTEPDQAGLICVALPAKDTPRFLSISKKARGALSVSTSHLGADVLHFYLLNRSKETGFGTLTITGANADPWQPMARCAGQAWQQTGFWLRFFADQKSAQSQDCEVQKAVAQLDAGLLDWSRRISQLALALPQSTALPFIEERQNALCTLLLSTLSDWSRATLALLVQLRSRGPLVSYGSTPFLRPVSAEHDPVPCFCRAGMQTAQGFAGPDGRVERVLWQCGQCGVCVDDDGARVMQVTQLPEVAQRGSKLRGTLSVSAGSDACCVVHGVMVFETWADGRVIASQDTERILAPGGTEDFELSLELPEIMTPGIYPLSILGLTNGVLHVTRRMIALS